VVVTLTFTAHAHTHARAHTLRVPLYLPLRYYRGFTCRTLDRIQHTHFTFSHVATFPPVTTTRTHAHTFVALPAFCPTLLRTLRHHARLPHALRTRIWFTLVGLVTRAVRLPAFTAATRTRTHLWFGLRATICAVVAFTHAFTCLHMRLHTRTLHTFTHTRCGLHDFTRYARVRTTVRLHTPHGLLRVLRSLVTVATRLRFVAARHHTPHRYTRLVYVTHFTPRFTRCTRTLYTPLHTYALRLHTTPRLLRTGYTHTRSTRTAHTRLHTFTAFTYFTHTHTFCSVTWFTYTHICCTLYTRLRLHTLHFAFTHVHILRTHFTRLVCALHTHGVTHTFTFTHLLHTAHVCDTHTVRTHVDTHTHARTVALRYLYTRALFTICVTAFYRLRLRRWKNCDSFVYLLRRQIASGAVFW